MTARGLHTVPGTLDNSMHLVGGVTATLESQRQAGRRGHQVRGRLPALAQELEQGENEAAAAVYAKHVTGDAAGAA